MQLARLDKLHAHESVCSCLVVGAAMLVALILAGCLSTRPRVNPAPPREYTITVLADRGWQESRIRVRAGQVIQCVAEGEWSDHFNSYGPEGNPDIQKGHFGVMAPANSLIMQIGQHTNISYYIGSRTNVVAERSGELRFRKNFSLPIGMKGEVKVRVKICDDADGDGLADYDEIFLWKTDPLSIDSDGDGFSDFEETSEIRAQFEAKTEP